MASNRVWMIDTSVFLNILNVPGRNQDRERVLAQYERRIENEDTFILPFTTVLETGNHIAQIKDRSGSGSRRKQCAERFLIAVRASMDGSAPWTPMDFPTAPELSRYLDLHLFEYDAEAGRGFGDYLILRQTDDYRRKTPGLETKIWSLDGHLGGS